MDFNENQPDKLSPLQHDVGPCGARLAEGRRNPDNILRRFIKIPLCMGLKEVMNMSTNISFMVGKCFVDITSVLEVQCFISSIYGL